MRWPLYHTWLYLSLLIVLLLPARIQAQQYDTASIFNIPLQLDSFIVKSGFDVKAFVRRVQTDTTFYKAFKNMRFVSYDAVNDIAVYDKKNAIQASMHSKTRQWRSQRCRITKTLEHKSTGDFYKRNGDYNYYTASLFSVLFFSKDSVCNEKNIIAGMPNEYGSGPMGKSTAQLKQLMFNPGAKVSGVPFMSDRASIFEPGEAEKYDFKIERTEYEGTPAYVFTITPKKGYEKKVLYDELTTWFRKTDYSILARNYSLSYHTLVYDFDVRMKVRTKQIGDKLYPTWISYDGNWHIFSKKREKVKFTVDVAY
jgi:hypothetical protein